MWKRVVGKRTLTFHLSGINNQNFLMRDEETGSWWQQVTGRAIAGPLRGAQLELVSSEEVTLGLWRQEHPGGMVLLGAPKEKGHYVKADWKLIDPEGDTWNFEGCATAGPHTGTCLPRLPYLADFWFDWHHYHPAGDAYRER